MARPTTTRRRDTITKKRRLPVETPALGGGQEGEVAGVEHQLHDMNITRALAAQQQPAGRR